MAQVSELNTLKITTAGQKIERLTKRIKVVQGGTSASKTYSILQRWIISALENNEEFSGINSIVSESMPHLKRGAMRDFFEILKNAGLYDRTAHNKTDSTYKINDSVFEFFSADQDDKLRGARRNNLFVNEANNVSKDAFDQMESRTKYGIWIDFNPVAEFWGHSLPGSDFIKLTYQDNECLHENIVRSIESRKGDNQWWKVYGLGEIGSVEGLILTNWSQTERVPDDAELLCTGLDFGFTNDPTVAVRLYRYNGEIILDEILYRLGYSNREIALHLKDYETGTIYADSAEPKSIAEIRKYGLPIHGAKKGKDSVAFGIDLLQQYKLRPTKGSVNVLKSLRNYSWDKDRAGAWLNRPNHAFSDPIDAIRYGAVMRLGNKQANYNVI